jgi:hypothetical protein
VRQLRGGVPPNPDLVAEFSGLPRCQLCGALCPHGTEAHHLYSRGAGGPDIRENLIGLGGPWNCGCHRRWHEGLIPRRELEAAVEAREGLPPGAVREKVFRLRRITR